MESAVVLATMENPLKPGSSPKFLTPAITGLVLLDDVVHWLAHGGPRHPKHRGWLHPICVVVVHYTLACLGSIVAHDLLLEAYYSGRPLPSCHVDEKLQLQRTLAAAALCVYSLFILVWRLYYKEPRPAHSGYSSADFPVLYEYCWLCNISLWLGAWALYSGRPILVSALCATVGIDQLLWYVDLAGYAAIGKFPIGVAKYLTWPQNAK